MNNQTGLRIGVITGINGTKLNSELIISSLNARGHTPVFAYAEHCSFHKDDPPCVIRINGNQMELDGVIVERIPVNERSNFVLLDEIHARGIPTISGSRQAWMNATDKRRTAEIFAQQAIPHPKTVVATQDELINAFHEIRRQGWLKVPISGEGRHVRFVENESQLLRAADELAIDWAESFLLQSDASNFDSSGRRIDYRVWVIENDVLGSYARLQTDREKPTNVSAGGDLLPYEPNDEVRELAKKAVQVLGLRYGAVDIAPSKEHGHVVFEVNVHGHMNSERLGAGMVSAPLVDAHIKEAFRRRA